MASVALLLCTALVLWLLVIEKRVSRRVSLALWIPTLWIMIAASRPLGTWSTSAPALGQGTYANNESGSAVDRWTLTGLAAVGIVVLVRRHFSWAEVFRDQKGLIILLAFMLLS